MAKTKETKVALKGENPKKAPAASKTARKVPSKSEEVVVESDSSESNSDSSSGSESEHDAEKRKNTKKPKVSRAKKTEPNSPPVHDDSDEDSDDDSDSGELAKTINAAKTKKKSAPPAVSTNGKVTKVASPSASSSEESSEEEEESSEENSSAAAEDSDEDMEDAPAQAPAPAKRAPVDPTRAIALQPFNPPAGFKPLDTKNASAKTLSSLLANSSSKQIWHITAPSSVPLTQIQSISLAAIQNQSSILTHKSTSYTLAEEKESKTNKKVLIPGDKGYSSVEVPVSKSLVLQQIISLPNLPTIDESAKSRDNKATPVLQRGKREPRPQPKGLRMRYKPLGHVVGEPGAVLGMDASEDEDVDMSDAAPAFRAPKGSQSEKEKEKKRKRDEEASVTPRTDKKRRKEKEGKKKATAEADLEEDTVEVLPGQEEVVKKIQDSMIEGTEKEVETEEAKARKKAEKKEKRKSEKKK